MSKANKKIHHGWQYRDWQRRVFEKGKNKCCLCGSIDNLTADHIKPIVTHPHLKYSVFNGRILCNNCRVKDMLNSLQKRILIKPHFKKAEFKT